MIRRVGVHDRAMELSGEGPRADLESDPSTAVPDLPEMPALGE